MGHRLLTSDEVRDYISQRPCQVGPCWMWLQDWFWAMGWGAVTYEHTFGVLKGKADALLFPIPVLTGGMHMWWWEVEQPLWTVSGSRELRGDGQRTGTPQQWAPHPRRAVLPPRCKAKLLLYLSHCFKVPLIESSLTCFLTNMDANKEMMRTSIYRFFKCALENHFQGYNWLKW